MSERQPADYVRHVIVTSSGSGVSYFDADGVRRQRPGVYMVRIHCACGWTTKQPVEQIDQAWAAHSDGDVGDR